MGKVDIHNKRMCYIYGHYQDKDLEGSLKFQRLRKGLAKGKEGKDIEVKGGGGLDILIVERGGGR